MDHPIATRFMRYVQIDTQSDPKSDRFPSTAKQLDLSRLLVDELNQIDLDDAFLDEHGYVFATIKGNSPKEGIPVLCFCAHVDTAPDCSGTGVRPIVHRNYQGQDLVLPDDPTQVLGPEDHPYLRERIGDDIITASGTTLLGADDKAGVAIIMELAAYLVQHPEIEHGDIRILFTPDEEVGRGVDRLDMEVLGADVGYTLDGGPRGSIEGDTFSANAMTVTFHGISAHPGYAKGKLVNAVRVLSHFIDLFPGDSFSPETTGGREGFVHPYGMEGELEQARVEFLIRDFDTAQLEVHQQRVIDLAQKAVDHYPGSRFEVEVREQYRNMREVLAQHPDVEAFAIQAMERAGVEPKQDIVRGGTDGSRLSFMGLPCPNLFTGEMGIHSKKEYVSVQDMEASLRTLVELVQVYAERA